jgi:hypothetical protein
MIFSSSSELLFYTTANNTMAPPIASGKNNNRRWTTNKQFTNKNNKDSSWWRGSPNAIKRTCCGDKRSLSAIKGSYYGHACHRWWVPKMTSFSFVCFCFWFYLFFVYIYRVYLGFCVLIFWVPLQQQGVILWSTYHRKQQRKKFPKARLCEP